MIVLVCCVLFWDFLSFQIFKQMQMFEEKLEICKEDIEEEIRKCYQEMKEMESLIHEQSGAAKDDENNSWVQGYCKGCDAKSG